MGPPGGPKDAWAVYNGSLYLNFFAAVRTAPAGAAFSIG